jgi:hypothetical protein
MSKKREPFVRFALRGAAIAAVLLAVFLALVLLILFSALPEGWNE